MALLELNLSYTQLKYIYWVIKKELKSKTFKWHNKSNFLRQERKYHVYTKKHAKLTLEFWNFFLNNVSFQ